MRLTLSRSEVSYWHIQAGVPFTTNPTSWGDFTGCVFRGGRSQCFERLVWPGGAVKACFDVFFFKAVTKKTMITIIGKSPFGKPGF